MSSTSNDAAAIELAVIPGLEQIAADEVRCALGRHTPISQHRPGTLTVRGEVDLSVLSALRTVGVVYLTRRFDVSRPRALLGHQHFRQIIELLDRVRTLHRPGAFSGLRVSAAGSDSTVFRRVAGELAEAAGLPVDPVDGDLVVRVHPAAAGSWSVSVRVTPRPLSARSWRIRAFGERWRPRWRRRWSVSAAPPSLTGSWTCAAGLPRS